MTGRAQEQRRLGIGQHPIARQPEPRELIERSVEPGERTEPGRALMPRADELPEQVRDDRLVASIDEPRLTQRAQPLGHPTSRRGRRSPRGPSPTSRARVSPEAPRRPRCRRPGTPTRTSRPEHRARSRVDVRGDPQSLCPDPHVPTTIDPTPTERCELDAGFLADPVGHDDAKDSLARAAQAAGDRWSHDAELLRGDIEGDTVDHELPSATDTGTSARASASCTSRRSAATTEADINAQHTVMVTNHAHVNRDPCSSWRTPMGVSRRWSGRRDLNPRPLRPERDLGNSWTKSDGAYGQVRGSFRSPPSTANSPIFRANVVCLWSVDLCVAVERCAGKADSGRTTDGPQTTAGCTRQPPKRRSLRTS